MTHDSIFAQETHIHAHIAGVEQPHLAFEAAAINNAEPGRQHSGFNIEQYELTHKILWGFLGYGYGGGDDNHNWLKIFRKFLCPKDDI